MPSCKEIATAVSSGEIEGAGPARRLAIRLHLWMCEPCRTYLKQMRQLGDAARRALRVDTDPEGLGRLEERVVERCGETDADGQRPGRSES